MKKSKTYLIITSSGGGGHLQAANAIEQEILSREQDIKIIKKDLLMDWVGFPFGNFSSSAWKFAQIYQFIYFQKIFAKLQRYAEIIFSPFVFIKLLKLLCKEEISFIYDTQCLTTRAIVLAIKIYNTKKNKDLKIQKIITDLPIKTSSHFFRSIKKLSDSQKKLLNIVSTTPYLEDEKNDAEFWQKFCSLPLEKVLYDYPVRQSFVRKTNISKNKIKISTKSLEERENILNLAKKSNSFFNVLDNNIEFFINEKSFVISVILGSQPAYNAAISYVTNTIEFIKKNKIKKPVVLFVYCMFDNFQIRKKFSRIINFALSDINNLHIIPMSFQNEETMASLYLRSNLTVTRSGGQTAMELKTISKGINLIHSEFRTKNLKKIEDKYLLNGIPVWEAGNALYMQKMMKAKLTNIDIFNSHLKNYL